MALAPEFLSAWLPSGRDAAYLVKVEITDPSAITYYLSTRPVNAPGSPPRVWQPGLAAVGNIIEHGDFGSIEFGYTTFDFTLTGGALIGQGVDDFAFKKFASHFWYGAAVTVYWWEMSMTDFTKAPTVFRGVVIDYDGESDNPVVYCQSAMDWVKDLPPEVTRSKFPRAPEKSIGQPAGAICYGSLLTPEARAPAAAYGLFQQGITSCVGLRRAGVRGTVVNLGKGNGTKGRVLFASHACKTFNSDVAGSTPAINVNGTLSEIDPIGANVINGASGTGFDFDDITAANVQPFDVFVPVPLTDSNQPASNPADNPRATTDVLNDPSYTLLDYDAGQRAALFSLPDYFPSGTLIAIKATIGFSASGLPAAPPGCAFEFVNPAVGSSGTFLANSATKTATSITVNPTHYPGALYDFSNAGCYLQVYFTGVCTGAKVRVHYCGLILQIRPTWPVVAQAYTVPGYTNDVRQVTTIGGARRHHYSRRERSLDRYVPAVERVDITEFLATLEGYADDGSGTYTGTAAALIERPPDILRHFLTTYCAQSQFETGVGEPGSLVDLRDDLKTWRRSDMKLAFAIDERKKSSDVLRAMASSSMCRFFISNFTGKWSGFAWKPGRAVDFPRRLTRFDITDPAGPKLIPHRDEVQNDIRIAFGRDAWSRRAIHQTFLSNIRSAVGHRYRNLRDENLTVVASESDRIDFNDSGGNHTANLTTGDYLPIDFAQHLGTQMGGVSATGFVRWAWGFEIKASFNDRVYFSDGSAKQVTLDPGYYTGEELALHVQVKLNASSSNWACTYSRATQKITISRSSGTAQLLWATGFSGTIGRTVGVTLGYIVADKTAGSPYTADFETEEERFAMANLTDNIKILWESGANGIDAATPRACGGLVGFDMARDYDEGVTYAIAQSPKNAREIEMATSVRRFGSRPPTDIELDYVNDTDTAREVRNRIGALWQGPPVEIQFPTERMPDLQQGMVFDFDASLDEVKPFGVPGTDGSWLGKSFVAVRVERRPLPTPHEFVIAFLVPAA